MEAREITTPVESASVHAAMLADGGHSVPCVSHALYDAAGRLVGAFSVAHAPLLFFWYDSRQPSPIGCARGFALAVEAIRRTGARRVMVAVQPDSPFYRWLPKLDASCIWSGEVWQLPTS